MSDAYLAGPMTGLPRWGFDRFDRAAARLRKAGWDVVSPAELDRAAGFDERTAVLPDGFMAEAMRRDMEALLRVDSIVLLDGWEGSRGTALELRVALALGLDVYEMWNAESAWSICHRRMVVDEPPVGESILEEAQRLVHGNRGCDYGHPADDLARTGRMWAALLGVDKIDAWQVALCMGALKMSREVNRHKRDNLVDLAGYTAVLNMIYERTPRE